jgi:hypothetical protein
MMEGTAADRAEQITFAELEARVHSLETTVDARLKAITDRYLPVSEERITKLWVSVRDTLDAFTNQLGGEQEQRRLQNEKIASLSAEVEALRQQVIMMTATAPRNHDEAVNDLAQRVLNLEREHGEPSG